jgi:phosphopantetheinyl transferase (holo-ACP synthase)
MPIDRDTNGRTHEPSLRELTAELDGIDKLLTEKIERLREVVMSALAAQKELTGQSFAASKEAIIKAENAQSQYNVGHNDLLKKQDAMIPRHEFDALKQTWNDKFDANKDAMKVEMSGMRQSIDQSAGKGMAWQTMLVIAGIIAGVLITYLTMAHHN